MKKSALLPLLVLTLLCSAAMAQETNTAVDTEFAPLPAAAPATAKLPEIVRSYIQEHVPGFELNQAEETITDDGRVEYVVRGTLNGRPIALEVEIASEDELLLEIEIKHEISSDKRRIVGAVTIDLEEVPETVLHAAYSAAIGLDIERVKRGTIGESNAYEIRGYVGPDQVEVKLLEDGTLLKIEKEIDPYPDPIPEPPPGDPPTE